MKYIRLETGLDRFQGWISTLERRHKESEAKNKRNSYWFALLASLPIHF